MAGTAVYRLQVRNVPEQVVGSIRGCVATAELDAWIAAAIHELFARLAEQRIQPAGTPFAIRPPPSGAETVEVEVALPAIRRVAARGRMTGRTVRSCRALSTVHRGSPAKVSGAYRALAVAMKEQGIEPIAEPREVYLTNPLETAPDRCETEVLWPVDSSADWQPPSPKARRPRARALVASRAAARTVRRRRRGR
jgi:effector-binding domain-containing protein